MFLKVYIAINPDLSVRESQTQKQLRLELAKRKENGESNIFIRRDHILKRRSPDQPQESTSETDGRLVWETYMAILIYRVNVVNLKYFTLTVINY